MSLLPFHPRGPEGATGSRVPAPCLAAHGGVSLSQSPPLSLTSSIGTMGMRGGLDQTSQCEASRRGRAFLGRTEASHAVQGTERPSPEGAKIP